MGTPESVDEVQALDDPVTQRRRQVDHLVSEGRPRRQRGGSEAAHPVGATRPHRSWSSHVLHRFGRWSSKAVAGVTVACCIAAWVIVGVWTGFPRWWETVLYSSTASVTVIMVFAIQHTQGREQVVTQRKLDELLRAQPGADDHLIAAEVASDEELEALAHLNSDDRRLADMETAQPPTSGDN
jgi:low affinity Fe/Cu permease